MNISAWAIRKPVPAILLFVVLTLLGLVGFHKLDIQNFPDMDFPTVMVNATLEGAAPAQLETEVARKLEDQLAALGGVEHINSTITDGSVSISVQFALEKNGEEALNQVRNAVDSARSALPAEMATPTVSKLSTSGSAILTYTVQSRQMDEEALSWLVDNEISKAMLATRGVGKLSRVGGLSREVLVELDPARLGGLGISTATVATQLKAVQRDASGGEGRVAGQSQSLRTLGAVGSLAELAALPIPLGDGRQVRLDQLGTLRDGHAERSSYAFWNGKPVVAFQLTRVKDAGEVAVAAAVRQTVSELRQRFPQVEISEAYNTVQPIEDNYHGSLQLLLEGAVLAVLVVFWFLRDWRATVVAATALPLSILPTFAVMHYLGFSLNVLTLLSLALVIGILVDDAIVEVENIVRHLRMGKTPLQAAREAADEIGLAVVATTLALVAVFLPTAFMSGISGKFFRQFGLTAAAAVLASLLVARLLTPMLAAYLLKPASHGEHDGPLMRRYLGWVDWCMAHRKSTMALACGFFIASLALVPLLPTGFVPANDQSQTQVTLELAPGSRLADTRKLVDQAHTLLAPLGDVKQVFATVGSSDAGSGGPEDSGGSSDVRRASLTLNLTPRSERSYSQASVEAKIRAALKPLAGARVSVGGANSGETLQLTLVGDDAETLEKAAGTVARDLRGLKGIGTVTPASAVQRPEIQIKPDYARAAELGVTSQALATAVRMATHGDYSANLAKLKLPQRQIDIRVRLADAARQDLDALGQLRIAGAKGEVSLASVAEISMASSPSQIKRRDRQRQATIELELGSRNMGEVMREANSLPSLQTLPAGVSQQAAGDAERMAELFGSFGVAMLVGILCIYIVLVLLFHDFLQPVTILAALPLSLGGAFLALLLTGNSFSMPAIIGLLMLMGVVTKNAILLVEYAVMARREHGMARRDALRDACHKRARPILMTTLAMAAGMLPIACGLGADPSFRAPMAITVLGGLLTSTLLSLLVIPVVFTYVDDLLGWLAVRVACRPAAERPLY
ncbi:efflux RND transporter permease subunit [Chitinimonas arctica]|uniref:Efflux RND transporter permease subunit n=1 Tax=Chitinimonas arctica TaxID=2594795 RepID=A0A516SID1_9NEIS|nr:efflux RND transporter permease subunit [Chitinimonas arctica]QDQ27905.1 efflux RND transporter permease subunit [Chitinimonas arctica]